MVDPADLSRNKRRFLAGDADRSGVIALTDVGLLGLRTSDVMNCSMSLSRFDPCCWIGGEL